MPGRFILAFVMAWLPVLAMAQREANVFFFGNSLIHHQTDGDTTTVPYWLARLAAAGGHGFAADGTWGFPADFARNLPPTPQWRFDGVDRLMSDDPRSFRMAGFDTVILSPPNFVQWAPPDQDTLDGTMLDLVGRTLDWARNQSNLRILIYEGWAVLADFDSFPPSDRALRRYHAFNTGDYDLWYRGFVDLLRARLPGEDIDLIPVARVISTLVTDGPLQGMGGADLYSDAAPHGTATTYLLAAMVTHAVLYAERPPAIGLPEAIHPLVRDNYGAVADEVWRLVAGQVAPQGASMVAPETGFADPSIGFGLAEIADWSPQVPFIDLMKTARPWIGHLPGQWGGVTFDDLRAGGFVDAAGWPLAIPDGVTSLEALILTDLPPGARSLAGRYVMTWTGEGAISVGGRATDTARGDHEISFGYVPGEGPVHITLTAIDPADPIRDIRVIRADHADLAAAGAIFNPAWLRVIRDARELRFMDWMQTNGSGQITWDDRPQVTDFSYAWRGAPVEIMVELANEIGADPWFTLPHMADDAYVTAFASYVRDNLDPRLMALAEWSSELWNFQFPQARWSQEQAVARWGDAARDDAWMQFAGTRAAEVADLWAAAYGDAAPTRLLRVIGTHTGWPGLEEPLLDAPLRQAEGLPAPALSFDAYAVSGYFGLEVGTEEFAPTLRDWIADGTATANVTAHLRDGSYGILVDEFWPYHAGVAADRGMRLVMYEGGTHVVGLGTVTEDAAITAFFTAYNYSPEMATFYADLIRNWRDLGDGATIGAFNSFVDVGTPSRWGSWGTLRHLDDMNPRWATVASWNSLPLGQPGRAPDAFTHGLTLRGTDIGDLIEGTPARDILIGGPGDDILVTNGGTDRLDGGPGHDRAVLPGVAADWTPAFDDDVLWMLGPRDAVRLTGVEEVTFTDEPDAVLTVAAPPDVADGADQE